MNRKKCFVIKDLIKFYGRDALEGETKQWVENHLLSCSDCKSWVDTFKEGYQDDEIEDISLTDKEKHLIKRVQLIFKLGIGVVLFLATWVSIWLFI